MLAQSSTADPVVQRVAGDPTLERVTWVLFAAVVALVLREAWQIRQARRATRARDRVILSALLRELSMILGVASSVHRDINKERELLNAQQRWRLKPLVRFPTTIYRLVIDHPPAALLEREGALPLLAVLEHQCGYSNALADSQEKWKTPDARGQRDQIETIVSFHEAIMESTNKIIDQCGKLQPVIVEAGETVGGLNLAGPPPRPSRWQRLRHSVVRVPRGEGRRQSEDDRTRS
jgi:hypothetical protein